jgi:hypothetical protein
MIGELQGANRRPDWAKGSSSMDICVIEFRAKIARPIYALCHDTGFGFDISGAELRLASTRGEYCVKDLHKQGFSNLDCVQEPCWYTLSLIER